MKSPIELMPTGIPGLDQVLEGGIVRGNSLLIEGPPGSGKSTLAIRILYEGVIQYGEPGLIVTFEEFPRQIYTEALNCGIDLQALEEAGKLRVIWTPPSRIMDSFRGKNDLVEKIIREIGVRRILIDSITHFKRVSTDEVRLRDILSSIMTNLKIAGVNALLVKELERQDAETIAFEEYLADASLRLHNRMQGPGGENIRYLEVRKTRGQGHISGLHPFRLDAGGIRISPRIRSRDIKDLLPASPPVSEERVGFGVAGLDAMLQGGLLPGKSALVSGYAGCGKSVLACHFLEAGLKAGGRVLSLSFKSTPEDIVADAKSLGMDWRPALEEDRLRILYFNPVGLFLEEVLDAVVHEIRIRRPDRFVCDSIDSLLFAAGGTDRLREHLLTIMALMRAAGTTSVFLHDVRQKGGESDESLGLVHMSACSIRLSMAESQGDLRRFIVVEKHSGSDHAKELREIRIDGQGFHVEGKAVGLSGILTGQAQGAQWNVSSEVLPALAAVAAFLKRIAASGTLSGDLLEEARKAGEQAGRIDVQLREHFGGIALPDSAVPVAAIAESARGPMRVLVVEDNLVSQRVAVGVLKKMGLETETADDGAQAVKALETNSCDLVLMDVEMPEMDGLEATRHIRDPRSAVRDHRIPVIAMTAHATQEDREKCMEAGMDDYLTKPIPVQALVDVLEKWLPGKGAPAADLPPGGEA